MAGEPTEKQEGVRATITMCELSLFRDDEKKLPARIMKDLPENADLGKPSSVDVIRNQPSKILLHELAHFTKYKAIDNGYFLRPTEGSSSPTIRDLNAEQLMINADVRSYLGQLAMIADRGYSFQRKPLDSAPQREKDAWNENMKIGKLFLYRNLTKRSLKRRMERLARRYNKV
ncbi:hypothetical protein K458DRAFT_421921 [Lentithecium fluviatile CBS 122367]|uniref:Uncharacterized protein n=1 Tax=Lentithecium fluviatile CBS 122367 TaxID=1168545 RepID=A0A6G1INK5_9PLEO|nr:hypothetical protein K458DRAFT_421921 [Lentithecium fluviatile CBS 122367]